MMAGILKTSHKHSDSSENPSGARMKFWGISCVSGKGYKQVVDQRFRLTMAVLDPESFNKEISDKIVSLSVIQNDKKFLLCILKHEEIYQVNLNLIFDKGDNVVFYISGHGTVHLSGYQMTDSSNDVYDDESGYLCPVAELKSKKEKHLNLKTEANSELEMIESKNKRKKLKAGKIDMLEDIPSEALLNMPADFDEDEDDEDDEDFDADLFEEDESESESDEEDISEDDLLDELGSDDLQDEGEEEIIQNSLGSQKRKAMMSDSGKRQKINHHNSSTPVENSEDVWAKANGDSDSDAGGINSSVGNTPMPKKPKNAEISPSECKKSKKKKKSSEISIISEKSAITKPEQRKSSGVENTPNKSSVENKGDKSFAVLKGGIESKDIVEGKGPVATKGKMVSIFYVGRLEDKTIFDARTPPKKPFSFKLGVSEVIEGLDVGVLGMKVGGQRKLKIPPNMAYGNKRGTNNVPRNSTVHFNIELQAVH